MADSWKWAEYYWQLCREFGSECYKTWRWELLASIVVVFFISLIERSWKDFKTALLATALTLACFALWHLIKAPWLLHRSSRRSTDNSHPETWAGIIGLVIIVAIFSGGYKLALYLWDIKPLGTVTIAIPVAPVTDTSAKDRLLTRMNDELNVCRKKTCPVIQPQVIAGQSASSVPQQSGPSPMFISRDNAQLRNTLFAMDAFLYFQTSLPGNAGGQTQGCWIKITAPKDNIETADTLMQMASLARCHVEYRLPDDLRPEIETEALNGATNDVITIHAPTGTRYDEALARLHLLFNIKREYGALNEGKPNETIWLQLGHGFLWQKQNTFSYQVKGLN